MENKNKEKRVIELEVMEELEESGVSAIALVDSPAIEKYFVYMRNQKFVEPSAGESESDFMSRCVPVLIDEGKDQDQAVAVCISMYEQKHTKEKFADYPWDECIADQSARGLDEESANRLCGWIRANMASMQFESYTDYPESATEAAKRALAWAEENGWGDCGTPIGKARANQLANREPISEETIARMASFARHAQNADTPYSEGCGKLMWDAWGGTAGIEWASNKLESIREKMSYDTSGLPPYVEQTPKKKKLAKFNEYGCPESTVDIELNLANRQDAIDQANYGPLNPGESNEEYWQAKADKFNTTVKDAKSATCGNCGFFVRTKSMLACIAAGVGEEALADPYDAIAAGELGYCEAFDFKCAAARTCDAWIAGGPILEEEEFLEPNPCWEGYEAYGLKDDGTPNCIPVKSKETKLAFAVEKEQQILVGPAMVPDMEILRRDEETGEVYYVKFSKETIAKIQEKFMRETRLGSTNLDHNDNVHGGSFVFESWLVEDKNDKANSVYKLGVPVGTWMVKMKVTDPKVWEMVKQGKYQGFSIEGNFIDKVDYEQIKSEKDLVESIMSILQS
jgi:hypothetical protein